MIGLERLGIPKEIQSYIKQLYNNISGKVVTKGWTSEEFSFKKVLTKMNFYLQLYS